MLRQEPRWNTYQEKQLNILEGIDKAFQNSLKSSIQISSSLSSVATALNSMADIVGSRFSSNINEASSIILSSAKKNSIAIEEQQIIVDQFGGQLVNVTQKMEKLANDSLKSAAEAMKRRDEALVERENERRRIEAENAELSEEIKSAMSTISSKITSLIKDLGESANKYSEISNELIVASGESADRVSDTRDEIVHNIIGKLNSETGNYFNAQEAYKTMADISMQTGIGNLETLEEITRPILLAQASMNISLNEVASLLGKWQTRYNFTSAEMESMIGDIRSSSAGNQSTAEATMKNIETLEVALSAYTGGDKEQLQGAVQSVSDITAYAESMKIDSTKFTQDLLNIMSGKIPDVDTITTLAKGGMSWGEAQQKSRSMDIEEVAFALLEGTKVQAESIKDLRVSSEVASKYGQDWNYLMNVLNAMESEGAMTYEEFLANKDNTPLIDIVEDKYVSATDQLINITSGISESLSDIQESLGFGLSDLAGMYVLYKGGKELGGSILKLLGGGSGVSGATGGGIASLLGKIGGALGVSGIGSAALGGGVVAVGVMSILGLVQGINDVSQKYEKIVDKQLDDLGLNLQDMGTGISQLSKSYRIDDEGNIIPEYSTTMVSPDNYDAELNKELIEEQAEQIREKGKVGEFEYDSNKSWLENLGDSFGATIKSLLGLGKELGTSEGKWYHSIPIVGAGISDYNKKQSELAALELTNRYENQTKLSQKIYGNDELTALVAHYNDSGMITPDRYDFFVKNVDKIIKLNAMNPPMVASSITEQGLNTPLPRSAVFGYATGSPYIDKDQLAYIHQGEAVIPKRYNPFSESDTHSTMSTALSGLRQGRATVDSESVRGSSENSQHYSDLLGITSTMNVIKEINDRRESTNHDNDKNELKQPDKQLAEIKEVLTEISDFLEYWQTENTKLAAMNRVYSKFEQLMTQYTTNSIPNT